MQLLKSMSSKKKNTKLTKTKEKGVDEVIKGISEKDKKHIEEVMKKLEKASS